MSPFPDVGEMQVNEDHRKEQGVLFAAGKEIKIDQVEQKHLFVPWHHQYDQYLETPKRLNERQQMIRVSAKLAFVNLHLIESTTKQHGRKK